MTIETALRDLLPRYGLPAQSTLCLINRSENETWRVGDVTAASGGLILRVHRPGYHSHAEITSELDWLGALQGHEGVRAVRPRAAQDGTLIQMAATRHVVAFDPITGREPAATDDLAPWFAPLGALTARLHKHARDWTRPAGFVRKRWHVDTILGPVPHWGDWRHAVGLNAEGRAVLERATIDLALRLKLYGTHPARFGLIHADLRLANLLIDDAGLWAIDFDDCGFGWWMYDFAAAVSFIETDPRLGDLAENWAAGYARHAPIGVAERDILPVLVFLRRVLLTAWLATRADSDTAQTLGGPTFTAGTIALAERLLTHGPGGIFKG